MEANVATQLKVLSGVVFGALFLSSGAANAQIITITQTNYVGPAPGNNIATAKPQGNYSVPAAQVNDLWQVAVDYGTIANGTFTPLPGGPAVVVLPVTPGAGGGPFNWGQLVATGINNPPAGLHARARLQKKNLIGIYTDQATTYHFCNQANPGGPGGPGGGD
jgi:hypothetical protein